MKRYNTRITNINLLVIAICLSVSSIARATDSDKPGQMPEDSIPIFPDLVYEYRITQLDNRTPIKLEYHPVVRRYIDVYTIERRDHLAKIIGKAELYFPIFEEKLDKYHLPLELKYLAIVESALDPKAISTSAAAGLWQFKINTSRMFDLQVDSYIDERCDPIKSTEAACSYLQYLYRIYQDWLLALAAYNGGPGEVKKAIERSGGKQTFWELIDYLPEQTRGYVPAFIAVNYAMNYYKEHDIRPVPTKYIDIETDTVHLKDALSFENLSLALKLDIEDIRFLNPVYKLDYIPEMEEQAVLTLPSKKVSDFLKHEEKLYSLNNEPGEFNYSNGNDNSYSNRVKLEHVVEKGEYFHKIAIKYDCTIDDILFWNDLPTNELNVGQKLDIWVSKEKAKDIEQEKAKPKKQRDENDRYIYYTVKEGDTIWSIATKFNCPSINELKEENNITDENDLKPGTRLKIYLNK